MTYRAGNDRSEICRLAAQLDAAGHGGRTALVEEFAELTGVSVNKVYRDLKAVGWSSGRKRRSDAGTTSQCDQALMQVSAALKTGLRENGKATMHIPTARSVLKCNGLEFAVGNSRLRTLLRQQQMHAQAHRQDKPFQALKSLHPNHVHQVDPSVCILFYLKDGSTQVMDEKKFYKNKPENVASIADHKVWRYVLTDHYSGTIVVRYYQARGESSLNLYDFLLFAWAQQNARPFHGVPRYLLWDKGSANTSGAIKEALKCLQVEDIPHAAGNPRAKGQVECANNIVECQFESRLKLEPVHNLDELNESAAAWANAFNANCLPEQDSRLMRRGMENPAVRYGLWQTIRQEQLRILPPLETCRYLLANGPQERKVRRDLTVTFRHPNAGKSLVYDLSHLDEVYAGAQVRLSPLVYGDCQALIYVSDYLGDERTYICDPVAFDPVSGFRADAAIIGEEFKRPPDTLIEHVGKAADRAAYGGEYGTRTEAEIEQAIARGETPFNGALDAHRHLRDLEIPAFMNRRGSELDVPDRANPDIKPLSHIQAFKRLVNLLGRAITTEENALVRRLHPQGVPESALKDLAEQIRTGSSPGLRIAR